MIVRERVLEALSTVRDPELDEPITELGFVESLEIEETTVAVTLRLPTYFCAPNFAYMMAADAKEAVFGVAGVTGVRVALADHFASNEINDGLARELGFDETFEGDTAGGGLTDLRDLFNRKAFIARQEKLARSVADEDSVARMVLSDLPATEETAAYLERRALLGLDTSANAPFLVTPDGTPIASDSVHDHLKFARAVRVTIEGNAGFCKGLLATRYGMPQPEEAMT
jgi:metal-sulfur cluster biosynthetic enzyme